MAKKKKQQKRSNVLWFYSGTANNVGIIRKRYQGKRGHSPVQILVDFNSESPVYTSWIDTNCNILCDIIKDPKTAPATLSFLELDRSAVNLFQKSDVKIVVEADSFTRLDWINIWNVSKMLDTRLKEYAKVHG